MTRLGDYFAFLGLPRRLNVDMALLERRFRELSREYHPDYFYNAPPAERLASLEQSAHLNDAYRTLRNPVSRLEYLLKLEGLTPVGAELSTSADASAGPRRSGPSAREGGQAGPDKAKTKVPPSLLEEVFALNEELDEIREARESGHDADALRARLDAARAPIDRKREEHERQLEELSARWDDTQDRRTLEALRERLLERNYINNLLATIDREAAAITNQESRITNG